VVQIRRLVPVETRVHHGALCRPYRGDVGTGTGQKRGYPGQREIELALDKLPFPGDRRRFDRRCKLRGCHGGSSSACRVRGVVPTVVAGVGRSPSPATHTALPCRCYGTRTSASGSRRQATRCRIGAMWTSKPRSTPLSMISPRRKFATRSPPLRRRACGWGAWCRLATGSRTARFTGAEAEGDDRVGHLAHVGGVGTGPLHRFQSRRYCSARLFGSN
jgi:hypothetical protein